MQKHLLALSLVFLLPYASIAQEAKQPDAKQPDAKQPLVNQPDLVPYSEGAKSLEDITEITVGKTSGGPPSPFFDPGLIVLRPDADKTSYASSSFYRLAHWMKTKRFFEMKEQYRDPGVSDCPSTIITVTATGKRYATSLTCYVGADAAELNMKFWELEMMIRGVAADIERFKAQKEREAKALAERK